MSEVFTAIDKMNELQVGENMNLEYKWTDNGIPELIVQLNFQLVRTNDKNNINDQKCQYNKLLKYIFEDYSKTGNLEYLKTICKLIAYTRDIISGKGEYDLSYMLISELYKHVISNYPDKYYMDAINSICSGLLLRFVKREDQMPYGSWKDLKYFLNYHVPLNERIQLSTGYPRIQNAFVSTIIGYIISQLKEDNNNAQKTLLAKWIPREKSKKFGWITPLLAMEYYKEWMINLNSANQEKLAKRKCLTHFRQLISKMNKELKTTQIYQCGNNWKEINFDKNVTSITLRKQSKAFAGNSKGNKTMNEDRKLCRDNYLKYIENIRCGKSIAKGERVSLVDFVRDGFRLLDFDKDNLIEREILNAQWKDNCKQNSELENCLAMVDQSGSMSDENFVPLYSAIGLGIRIAENSKFGKRILSFSANPTWINLDDCEDFMSILEKIKNTPSGTNTNFRNAFDKIINSAINSNIHPDVMNKMSLIILSDMQIDQGDYNDNTTMFEMMKEKYHNAGLSTIHNQPYKLPHIIFWNLRTTNGFPTMVTTPNTSMMSGNNTCLLNSFCDKGTNSLNEITPWRSLNTSLSINRYNNLDNMVNEAFTPLNI